MNRIETSFLSRSIKKLSPAGKKYFKYSQDDLLGD